MFLLLFAVQGIKPGPFMLSKHSNTEPHSRPEEDILTRGNEEARGPSHDIIGICKSDRIGEIHKLTRCERLKIQGRECFVLITSVPLLTENHLKF
jgi:hypothetical protein